MCNASKIRLVLAATLSLSAAVTFAAPPNKYVEGQILVKGKAGLSDARLEKILSKAKGRSIGKLQQIDTHIVEVPPQAEEAVIRALAHNPQIDFAEKNRLVEPSAFTPNDPSYSSQWHLPKIQAPNAWDGSAGSGIMIAIVDSGVEASHPDLIANLVPGWNVVSNNADTSPVHYHGTRVAGVAAATGNNATGIASVAWDARIMPLRITDRSDGWANWSDMAAAIIWAADHGAKVVNLSYDMAASSAVTNAAQYLRNKGGVALTSAGNANTDNGYPDNPYVITVAATTSSDAKASWSNFGADIDVAAPGASIYTTNTGGGYTSGSGTSYASPTAAGVVALIMAANPQLTPAEVESILETSADDLGSSGWDPYFGYGRVNAAAAVQIAKGSSVSDTQAPGVAITTPGYGSTVAGQVLVNVSASDNVGVSEVALYANGQMVGSDSTAPYEFSWDSTNMPNGAATLTAYASDAAGNTGISSGTVVNVENQIIVGDTTPPNVSILVSAESQNTVSGNVTVTASAIDDTGVTNVVLYVNGQMVGSDSTVPYEFLWDSTTVQNGNATFTAYAYDAAGNTGISSAITVVVDNSPDVVDSEPPIVSIINLIDGDTVSGTVGIMVNAGDNVGVTQLSLYVDNALACSNVDTTSLSCNWNTRKENPGSHTMRAIASDAAGNSGQTTISVSIADSVKGKGNGRGK